MEFLKSRRDRIHVIDEESPVRELATNYQNSLYSRLVIITVKIVPSALNYNCLAGHYTGSLVTELSLKSLAGKYGYQWESDIQVVFMVEPYYFYKVIAGGGNCTAEIKYWYEYDLHQYQL
ncbi:hypothetical protein M0R72_11495 [Candidatus Pacearchaeota archaeon]|nr:hypothetical protein [Candidatus Pacearchaeota archaeon]